jgi:hypothetical protein
MKIQVFLEAGCEFLNVIYRSFFGFKELSVRGFNSSGMLLQYMAAGPHVRQDEWPIKVEHSEVLV